MKFIESDIDPCTGSKLFSLCLLENGRSLIGIHYGYICVFFRIFHTNYELVDTTKLPDLNSCDVEDLTHNKFYNFMEKKLTISDRISLIILPYLKNRFNTIIGRDNPQYIQYLKMRYKEDWKQVYKDVKKHNYNILKSGKES